MLLKFLRKKNVMKRIMLVIASLIIPAFVLWGVGSAVRSSKKDYAGEISGQKVPLKDYIESWEACRNQYLLIYGKRFNEIAKFINLEEKAWERLVLLKLANEQKIKVTNKEIIQNITASPLFQRDGVFDEKTYQWILRYQLGIMPREFEEELRDTLKIAKLTQNAMTQIEVSDEEILRAYKTENQEAKADYIFVKSEDFKNDIAATEENLKDFYGNNKTLFMKGEQTDVSYISIAFDDFKDTVEITEEEIKEYYETNKSRYEIEKTEPEEEKSQEETAEGENSADAENEDTDSPEEKEAAEYRSLDEVREEIKETLVSEEAAIKAKNIAMDIEDFLIDNPNFEEAAAKFSLPVRNTGFFSRGGAIPEVGWSYEFSQKAFELDIGDFTEEAVKTPKGYYFLKVKEKKDSYVHKYEDVKEKVIEEYTEQKSKELAKNRIEEIFQKIKPTEDGTNPDFKAIAAEYGLELKTTPMITQNTPYIQEIGNARSITNKLFSMTIGEITEPIPVQDGFCIFQLTELEEIDEEAFNAQKEELRKKVLDEKSSRFYTEWVRDLVKKAEIKSNLDKLKDNEEYDDSEEF